MKKRFLCVLAFASACAVLASCSFAQTESRSDSALSEKPYISYFVAENSSAQESIPDTLVKIEEYLEPPEQTVGEGYSAVEPEEYYCYNRLTDAQKRAYRAMYSGAMNMTEKMFCVGNCTERDVSVAYYALKNDYPQIFWLGTAYATAERGGMQYIGFNKREDGYYGYPCDETERDRMWDEIVAVAETALSSAITDDMGAYERELALHDWLCDYIEYDYDAADSNGLSDEEHSDAWTVYGALVERKAVCEGYARAYQLLLYYAGIPCTVISGTGESRAHIWNMCCIDGKWYQVDVTWDDEPGSVLGKTHRYFNLTADEMYENHTPYDVCDNVAEGAAFWGGDFNFPLEACNSSDKSYYMRGGGNIEDSEEFADCALNAFVRSGGAPVELRLSFDEASAQVINRLSRKSGLLNRVRGYFPKAESLEYEIYSYGVFIIRIKGY